MKTKFIKTLFVNNPPLSNGKYLTNLGELDFVENNFKNELGLNINGVEWYLKELPDREEEYDKQLDIIHKHLDIIENQMCNILNDPVKEQIEKCLEEVAELKNS